MTNKRKEDKSELTRQQKYGYAATLFLKDGLTQKEIAAKVDVAESTVSRWAAAGNWDKLKISFLTTKEQELSRLYMQLRELNDAVMKRPEGERFVSNKEADTLTKLTAAIRSLETENNLSDKISVSRQFLDWMRRFDLERAQELSDMFDAFIRETLK
jgi:transcriptional regulator with XRE-family HTH domain